MSNPPFRSPLPSVAEARNLADLTAMNHIVNLRSSTTSQSPLCWIGHDFRKSALLGSAPRVERVNCLQSLDTLLKAEEYDEAMPDGVRCC